MITEEFKINFNKEEFPCFFIQTKDKALELIGKLSKKEGLFAADLETAADPKWKHIPKAALYPQLSTPRLLQLFTGRGAAVIDLWATGKVDLSPLFHKRSSVFHNMTFDYKFLRLHHKVTTPDMHCTCIMARMVFHAIYPHDLKADLRSCVKAFFKEDINKEAGASDWSRPLTFEQVRYAATDVVVLYELYKKLDKYITDLGLRKAYDLYRKAQLVLCEMELNGISIDKEKHLTNVVKWRDELGVAADLVLKSTNLDRISDSKIAGWLEKTLPKEILDIWPRTEKDEKLSTDANTLVDFSHLEVLKPFAQYQKIKKLTTSFGAKFLSHINPATNKLHCNYVVAGAKTGRLSCREPNIQQAPRDKAFRSVFVPSPGYVMVVADYSQVEVRYIAELSQDPKMLEAFEEGLDIYSYTASKLTGIPYEEIEEKDENGKKHPARQQAKALVLGLNYGLGPRKFAHYAKKGYGVEITEQESYESVTAYRELYSDLREWQLRQVAQCQANRYNAYTVMGKSRKMTEDSFYGACMNHPVQGGCAEIMLLALVYAQVNLKGTSGRMLASVHDEILVECLPKDVEEVKKLLSGAMLHAYEDIVVNACTLKNLVEPSSGINWAEAKK